MRRGRSARLQALTAPIPRLPLRILPIGLLFGLYLIWRVLLADTSFPRPLHPQSALPLTSTPRVIIQQTIFIPAPTIASCFMGIFGRAWPERDLYQASVRGYEKYAQMWGYGYRLETQRWVEPGLGVKIPHLNKMHAVLNLAKAQLEVGDMGTEWIMTADTDSLILDPSIPLTYFLPPPQQVPAPTVLVNQDHNGLNAGIIFWRVSPRLIEFLEATLSYQSVIEAATGKRPYSDQHLYCYALQRPEQRDFADGLYEIPQRWFNGYHRPPSQQDESAGDMLEPAVIMHLVNWVKWREPWKKTIRRPVEAIYKQAERTALEQDLSMQDAFLQSEVSQAAKLSAERWWSTRAVAGTGSIRFNEY